MRMRASQDWKMPKSLPRLALSEVSIKHNLASLERNSQSEHRELGVGQSLLSQKNLHSMESRKGDSVYALKTGEDEVQGLGRGLSG